MTNNTINSTGTKALTPSQVKPREMGARVYRNGEKLTEGLVTKVTTAGAYVWNIKEGGPEGSAEWFPFFANHYKWSFFNAKRHHFA